LGRLPGVRTWRAAQLRRLQPLAGGRPRGTALVRYYWSSFLELHHADVRGACLEIGSTATLKSIGSPGIASAQAMDLRAGNGIDIVADLSRADGLAAGTYDCFVAPFTMHLIYDVEAALYHAVRILKPGGVLLVNFPCVDYYFPRGLDMGNGEPLFVFWMFTPIQVENLLRRVGLPPEAFEIRSYGNLFARVAYQVNLPAEELSPLERSHNDAGHPLLLCARIVKPHDWTCACPEYRDAWRPDVAPAKWSRVNGHYPPA
jgi:SAM-dependent methyltransferase